MKKSRVAGLLRREPGFTLIELLVVVLIIGILAAIAIPQYFKVVERGRLSEADTMASQIKQSEERYLARYGVYAVTNDDLNGNLDIVFSGTSSGGYFGMRYFNITMGTGGTCTGGPNYNIALLRTTTNAGVAARYGSGGYTLVFDRCNDVFTYPSCANCSSDFSQ